MLSRSNRSARQPVSALIAVVALLGQALFPHVHAWHGPRDTAAHADVARCVADCPTELASAAAPHADADSHQHASTCPLCRAQSDARSSLVPPSFAVPLPAMAPSALPSDAVASLAAALRSLASPRAPPFVA